MTTRILLLAGATALALAASPAVAQEHQHGQHGQHTPPADPTPPPAEPPESPAHPPEHLPQPAAPPLEHGDHGAQPAAHAGHAALTGALGPYPLGREASGTAWQPDNSVHGGAMGRRGDWTLMAHGVLNLVHDRQGGARGDDKTFVSGMAMASARRPLGNGTLQLRGSLSPDPLMGKSGYPLLLASGETADGEQHLIDRQHPHDLLMELSASVSQDIGRDGSVLIYAGLPGEPAFGPPAFMHREAAMNSPEAPISHHWLDSTHVSFGVATFGLVLGNAKVELSRFNGREPDQHRWNIETGPLDSTAVRLSVNPTRELSLQGSWGRFKEPEQLEPGVDQTRWSASALYAREIAPGTRFSGTIAWGRKSIDHHGELQHDDAFVAEAGLKTGPWTLFGRGEMTENRELVEVEGEHGPAYRVGKVSLGGVRDFALAGNLKLGIGGLVAVNVVPGALEEEYGGRNPLGAMGFVRLKLD